MAVTCKKLALISKVSTGVDPREKCAVNKASYLGLKSSDAEFMQ